MIAINSNASTPDALFRARGRKCSITASCCRPSGRRSRTTTPVSRCAPYPEHAPDIISVYVERQLFMGDFLIEETTLERTFGYGIAG